MGKLEDSYIAFSALQVAELIKRAQELKDDVIWFVRGASCYLRLPSQDLPLQPLRTIVGTIRLCVDDDCPRVEVLELHDKVLREVARLTAADDLTAEAEFGIIFNIDEEYQLRLFSRRHPFKEKTAARPLMSFGPILE